MWLLSTNLISLFSFGLLFLSPSLIVSICICRSCLCSYTCTCVRPCVNTYVYMWVCIFNRRECSCNSKNIMILLHTPSNTLNTYPQVPSLKVYTHSICSSDSTLYLYLFIHNNLDHPLVCFCTSWVIHLPVLRRCHTG